MLGRLALPARRQAPTSPPIEPGASVSVKNIGSSPAFWSATNTEIGLTDDSQWARFDAAWSGQQITERDKEYSGDADLINPCETEYDYLLFSIPKASSPAGSWSRTTVSEGRSGPTPRSRPENHT